MHPGSRTAFILIPMISSSPPTSTTENSTSSRACRRDAGEDRLRLKSIYPCYEVVRGRRQKPD